MSESLSKLADANVEPSLRNFQRGAVGSIEMMSVGFYGIIEAFQSEMEKSRDIEEKIEKSVEDIFKLKEDLSCCNAKCIELSTKLDAEMSKIRKTMASQSADIDKRLSKMKAVMSEKCEAIKTECADAIEAVKEKVGKSVENIDRMKADFENLEQECNDQLRGLSMRCDENKELIEEQDGKFKDSLNELTEILHQKAMDLDNKIEVCLAETTEKCQQMNEKQQIFQFETNNELAQKADIEDLKHKLDKVKYEEFMADIYHNFVQKMDADISKINQNMSKNETKTQTNEEEISGIKALQDTVKSFMDSQFAELRTMISNPVDVDGIKKEISDQMEKENEAFREEMIALIRASAQNGANQPSSMGTQNGNCIACGRGPSNFQPLPVKSPSPKKKPQHGGGFSRLPSRRKSMHMSPSSDKLDKLIDSKLSPTKSNKRRKSTMSHLTNENKKVVIENDAVRVKIPDVNDA